MKKANIAMAMFTVLLASANPNFSHAQSNLQLNWNDTLQKYLKTPPNQSIIGFGEALKNPDLKDSIQLKIDMMVALVNDYAQTQNIDSSYYYASMANQLAIQIEDSMRMSRSFLSLAWITRDKGDIAGVLEYTLKAEELAGIIDNKKLLSYAANTLASVYYDIKNDSLQKYYLEKSYKLEKELGVPPITPLTNLGYLYFREGDSEKAIKSLKEALELSFIHKRGFNNSYLIYNHLIDIYEKEENYTECIRYCDSLIKVLTDLQWDDGITQTETKKIYFKELSGENPKEKYWLNKFTAIDISTYSMDAQKVYLFDKSRFNRLFGNYEVALENLEQLRSLVDSLAGEDIRTQVAFYKERFDAVKRENKISQLEDKQLITTLESEKQQTQITFLIIGLIGVVAFAVFLVLLYGKLRKTKAALVELNAVKDKFFAIIAHDLRSPMIALQGVGQKLDYYIRKGKQDKLMEIGEKIDITIDQLNHLLNNLLNWAVSQTGDIPYHPRKLDAKKLIEENLILYQTEAETKNVSIIRELEDLELYADANTFSTIVRNLVSNAVKFTKLNSQIVISCKLKDGKVELQIKDEGKGMETAEIEKLLSSKLKSNTGSNKELGFGIGLKISQEFISLNNGKLYIDSTVGKGTIFTILLPLNKVA